MSLRPLVISNHERRMVAQIIAYAKAHPYTPAETAKTPGDNPRHVTHLGTYRVVFSFTRSDGMLWRHLSVSVPSSKFPNPAAAFLIGSVFGFTGWDEKTIDRLPEGWVGNVSHAEHCIVLAQPIENLSGGVAS